MSAAATAGRIDWEGLELSRRAAYRRVLAILRGGPSPFLVAGSLAASIHLGELIPGDLEIFVPPSQADGVQAAFAAAGLRLEPVPGLVLVGHDHPIRLAWTLPPSLGGDVDDAWFTHAVRRRILDLRVSVAAVEELLWLRIAIPGGGSISDQAVPRLLTLYAAKLDWNRLLARMAGLEHLLLAHLFLFHHEHSAAQDVPSWVLERLFEGHRGLHGGSATSGRP